MRATENLARKLKIDERAIRAAVAVEDGGGEIQPSRILNIVLNLNFFYEIHEISEVINLQNVPVYDSAAIEGIEPSNLQSVLVNIPTSKKDDVYGQFDYGDAICGHYSDGNGNELTIMSTGSGPAVATESANTLALVGINGNLTLQALPDAVDGNTLSLMMYME